MSDVAPTRGGSSRGRGSSRGGRGGFRGSRNTVRTKRENDEPEQATASSGLGSAAAATTTLDDHGEIGELKRKYGDKVPLIREVFPTWSDEDLVFSLRETDGDIEEAIDRISSGTISQWGEVKKKHHPKSKEATASTDAGATRGRAGRGSADTRGRGRGGGGGERSSGRGRSRATAGTKHTAASITVKEADDGWAAPAAASTPVNGEKAESKDDAGWAGANSSEPKATAAAAAASATTTTAAPAPATAAVKKPQPGGWAGLFARPTEPPAPAAPVASANSGAATTNANANHSTGADASAPAAPATTTNNVNAGSSASTGASTTAAANAVKATTSVALPQPPPIEPQVVEDSPAELPSAPHSDSAPDLPPPKDDLTPANLEQLPDQSHPPGSHTAASTTASSQHPLAQAAAAAAKAPVRPASGYAATALKATGAGGATRSASYSRKVLDQQEAVVMPGNHAIEKAAVQFGKMGLNGDSELDVDEDREEPETRTQLPDDSPSAPRASLPPSEPGAGAAASVHSQVSPEAVHTGALAQQPAPGLPAPNAGAAAAAVDSATGQPAAAYADPYRYGPASKSYDPFGQPAAQPPTHPAAQQAQEPFSNQVPGQGQPGAAHAASQSDYANYYNNRDAYQQYYGSYGHAQDVQRVSAGSISGSAYVTSSQDVPSQYATARSQAAAAAAAYPPPDAQGSGTNTPAPTSLTHQSQPQSQPLASHAAAAAAAAAAYPYGYPAAAAYNQQYPQYGANYMNQLSAQHQHQHQHRYGANRPMFDDARRQEEFYSSQYGYSHSQQPFGNSYKSNMYGQPQQHQQYPYDQHSSSPANVSAFGARDGYGRSGSAQPSEPQQSTSSSLSFGAAGGVAVPDPFGRTSSAFGHAQSQALSQQHSGHQAGDDASKSAAVPSPSIQAGRPGSTVNSVQGQQHNIFPPASQQQGQQHGPQQQQQGQQGQGQQQGGQQQGQQGQNHQGQQGQGQQGQHQVFGGGAYPQYGGTASGAFGGFGQQQQSAAHQNAAGYVGYGSNAFGSYAGYGGGRGWTH